MVLKQRFISFYAAYLISTIFSVFLLQKTETGTRLILLNKNKELRVIISVYQRSSVSAVEAEANKSRVQIICSDERRNAQELWASTSCQTKETSNWRWLCVVDPFQLFSCELRLFFSHCNLAKKNVIYGFRFSNYRSSFFGLHESSFMFVPCRRLKRHYRLHFEALQTKLQERGKPFDIWPRFGAFTRRRSVPFLYVDDDSTLEELSGKAAHLWAQNIILWIATLFAVP